MRRGLCAVAAAVAAVVVAGCGGQSPPEEVIAAAPERTQAAGTAHMSMELTGPDPGEGPAMTSEGDIDFANDRAQMTVDVGDLPLPGGGPVTMILDGDIIYTQLPVPGQSGWFRIDAAEVNEALTGLSGALGGEDPMQALQLLRGASDVRAAGSEDVNGVAATRYDVTVDLAEAVRRTPEEQRDAVRQQFEMLGTDELPMSVWIDGEGRLRRLHYQLDLEEMDLPGGGEAMAAGTADFTLELSDFGAEVDIELPPEEDVTDFTELLDDVDGRMPTS